MFRMFRAWETISSSLAFSVGATQNVRNRKTKKKTYCLSLFLLASEHQIALCVYIEFVAFQLRLAFQQQQRCAEFSFFRSLRSGSLS